MTTTPGTRPRRLLSALGAAASSTAAHAPENAAYGLMAMTPLGAAYGPSAMALALLGAALASAVASLLGAGRLAGDAGAALALLTTALVSALIPHVPGSGADAAQQVLFIVALAVAAAGVLQMLYGALRLGAIVKFTPYPVRTGLASGVGLLLIGGAAPALAGHGFGAPWPSADAWGPGAAAIGLLALGTAAAAARAGTRVPPLLLGLVAASLLHHAAAHAGFGGVLGPTVGVPALPASWVGGAAAAPDVWDTLARPGVLALLGVFALTASVIASLDTLLAASIVDGRLRHTRDANRELIGQGVGNLASAAVGGLPASPSVPASLGLVMQQPAQRHIVLFYAGALAGVVLFAPALLGALPSSAVGGVLVYLGLTMVSPTLWQTPAQVWRLRRTRADADGGDHGGRLLAANWVVTVAVALGALVLGLGPAVLIGASCAVLLFVRANIRDVVGRVWTGERRHSLKTRPPAMVQALRAHGGGIVLLELQGALFFGTADALRARLHTLAPAADTVILDLHQVGETDLTAARILVEIAEDWARAGRTLVFAEWSVADPRRRQMEQFASASGSPALRFEPSADLALEHAEERLLERLQVDRHVGEPLPLAATTIARGLTDEELGWLDAAMTTHRFRRGEVLFRAGDAGDVLFVSLQGQIGLRLPGTQRRLASFAPGVVLGEMSVLAGEPRSAEAVAESDVVALAVSREAFERLLQSRPELGAKLLRNIAVHLADRVRVLTGDLAGWVSRAGALRPAAAPAGTGTPGPG